MHDRFDEIQIVNHRTTPVGKSGSVLLLSRYRLEPEGTRQRSSTPSRIHSSVMVNLATKIMAAENGVALHMANQREA